MKQYLVIILLLGLALPASAQKSRVLAVKQMIDAGKYDEAKEAIELAIWNDRTSMWHRTYYTKGLLCQTAYEAGMEKKDTKMTNLYPDQLFLAYDSYEKALELDARERMHNHIRLHYYSLANDFKNLGEELYQKGEYKESLRSFEHALLIGKSDLVSFKTDTSLVYNAAMAAYEGGSWEKAVEYLTVLHEDAYSTRSTLLLAIACHQSGDTVRSQEVLVEGLELYQYDESLVMYLVNDLASSDMLISAINILSKAIEAKPDDFIFYWARGLGYRRLNDYDKAMSSFLQAADRAPDTPTLYYHIGVSYYNIGIDLRESALSIVENDEYQAVRQQYLEKFREAVKWLERSYELEPENEKTQAKLNQLYYQLDMKEQQKALELLDN